MVLIQYNIFAFTSLLIVSFYISLCILLLAFFRKKILTKQKAKLLYAISIIIAVRSLLVINIHILTEAMKRYITTITYVQNYMHTRGVGRVVRWMNRQNYLGLLQYIWILGMICITIYYLTKYIAFHKTLHRLKINLDDSRINEVLKKQKQLLQIHNTPKIYVVNGLGSPMLVGIYNPQIILPKTDYSIHELEYIFRHELIHFKRKDNLIKLLVTLVTIIHWFNPCIYVLRKLCNDVCELSCDESVIRTLNHNEKQKYSLLLLKTVRHTNKLASSMGISYLNTNTAPLTKYRIERMFTPVKYKDRTIIMCMIICTLMIFTMFSSSWITFANWQ